MKISVVVLQYFWRVADYRKNSYHLTKKKPQQGHFDNISKIPLDYLPICNATRNNSIMK